MSSFKTINVVVICVAVLLAIAGLIIGLSLESDRNHHLGGFRLGDPIIVCVKDSS